jgi:hypothetical protein
MLRAVGVQAPILDVRKAWLLIAPQQVRVRRRAGGMIGTARRATMRKR